MFDFLKPGKGYAITLNNGRRIEVDFGPMSRSEKNNSSQKECDHSPASRDAEIRVYMPDDKATPSDVYYNADADMLVKVLGNLKTD